MLRIRRGGGNPLAGHGPAQYLLAMYQAARRIRACFGIREYGTVDSTNLEAIRLARAGAPAGTVVSAVAQEAGRGRLGRSWLSPPGSGLYLSLLLRPDGPPAAWGRYAIGSAVALAWACERGYGIRVQVKWPNDVLVAGRKLAGILVEGASAGMLVVGIGVNLAPDPCWSGAAFRREPTSLSGACGRGVDRAVFRDRLLDALAVVQAALHGGHWGLVLEAARRRLYGIGRDVRIGVADRLGEPAVLLGLGAEGALRLRDAGGAVRECVSGEVVYADRD